MKNISIAIHGGARTILKSVMKPEQKVVYTKALQSALDTGYEILNQRASALEAVEKAVTELENTPLFNAGKGAVFTSEGTHEMDASIMEGNGLEAGAVSGISGIKNPIRLARLVSLVKALKISRVT